MNNERELIPLSAMNDPTIFLDIGKGVLVDVYVAELDARQDPYRTHSNASANGPVRIQASIGSRRPNLVKLQLDQISPNTSGLLVIGATNNQYADIPDTTVSVGDGELSASAVDTSAGKFGRRGNSQHLLLAYVERSGSSWQVRGDVDIPQEEMAAIVATARATTQNPTATAASTPAPGWGAAAQPSTPVGALFVDGISDYRGANPAFLNEVAAQLANLAQQQATATQLDTHVWFLTEEMEKARPVVVSAQDANVDGVRAALTNRRTNPQLDVARAGHTIGRFYASSPQFALSPMAVQYITDGSILTGQETRAQQVVAGFAEALGTVGGGVQMRGQTEIFNRPGGVRM
ncbi:MAG: hypothetical protein HOQ05_13345 [Corynebacteriales bacterium]|nr:hypothetical protein [Mycobacteriales bacterium]